MTDAEKAVAKLRPKRGSRAARLPLKAAYAFFHAHPNKASELGRIGGAGDVMNAQPTNGKMTVVNEITFRRRLGIWLLQA